MSNYVEIYDVCKESGIGSTSSMTASDLVNVCPLITTWINEKFSDILEAKTTVLSTTTGQSRVEVYPKGNTGLGVILGGSTSTTNGKPGIGYIKSGTAKMPSTVAGDGFTFEFSVLNYVKFKVIRSEYGFVADFIVPTVTSVKNCNLLVSSENDMSYMVFNDGSFASSNTGTVTDCGSLPLRSQYDEKMLSKITQPCGNFLYEHMFVSDKIITGNVPYTLNGNKYVDVCANSLYRGLALEL